MYALASNLRGFRVDSLRVRIVRWASETQAVCRTADLLDAGTPLVLDRSQLAIEDPRGELVAAVCHQTGLVYLGG